MNFDVCPACEGTGKRNPVSGEKCFRCWGMGFVENVIDEDEEWDQYADWEEDE